MGDSGPGKSPGFTLVRVAHHLRPAMRGGRIPLAARSPDSGERPGGKGNARGRGFEAREGRRPGGSWPDRSPGDRPDQEPPRSVSPDRSPRDRRTPATSVRLRGTEATRSSLEGERPRGALPPYSPFSRSRADRRMLVDVRSGGEAAISGSPAAARARAGGATVGKRPREVERSPRPRRSLLRSRAGARGLPCTRGHPQILRKSHHC